MDKRVTLILSSFIFGIFLISLISAACVLSVSLVNQDPHPAVQGETVDLLFQLSGVNDPSCEGASFRLDPGYSFTLSAEDFGVKRLQGSTFSQGSKTDWVIPYTLQVREDALQKIVRYYTREAGVRNLERQLASICRKAACLSA